MWHMHMKYVSFPGSLVAGKPDSPVRHGLDGARSALAQQLELPGLPVVVGDRLPDVAVSASPVSANGYSPARTCIWTNSGFESIRSKAATQRTSSTSALPSFTLVWSSSAALVMLAAAIVFGVIPFMGSA
jgi:hypothetical protein